MRCLCMFYLCFVLYMYVCVCVIYMCVCVICPMHLFPKIDVPFTYSYTVYHGLVAFHSFSNLYIISVHKDESTTQFDTLDNLI